MGKPNVPIRNLRAPYGVGLSTFAAVATNKITVEPGAILDRTGTNDIILKEETTLNFLRFGPNGLDTPGGPAPVDDTPYFIFVIGDSTKYRPTATLASLDPDNPQLPVGYDIFAGIGYCLFISGFLQGFITGGDGLTKKYTYDSAPGISDLETSTVYADISYGTRVPYFAGNIVLQFRLDNSTADNNVFIRRKGSTAVNGSSRFYAPMVGQSRLFETNLADNADSPNNGIFQYKVTGPDFVQFNVKGFSFNMG